MIRPTRRELARVKQERDNARAAAMVLAGTVGLPALTLDDVVATSVGLPHEDEVRRATTGARMVAELIKLRKHSPE